jgi:hypothetical protein
VEALRRGDKIAAIKHLREHTGLGLKEAKDAIDASPETPRLSPGEVPRSHGLPWWLVALLLLGGAAYLFSR